MTETKALDVEQVYRFLEQYLDWNAPKATIKNELERLYAAGVEEGIEMGKQLARDDPAEYYLRKVA